MEKKTIKLKVEKNDEGKRLDLYLAFQFNELTRSTVKKQVEAGNVRSTGEVQFKPNYRVKEGDEVICDFVLEDRSGHDLLPQDIDLDVIYEDETLLAVNKPIGMVVHPATSNWDNTLLNAVLFRNNEIGSVGDPSRPGLIHRLDKDTSGVVLIGKTNEALWHYTKLFSERRINKTYLAIVRGDFFREYGDTEVLIDNYLGRNSTNRKKFAKVSPSKGKKATTNVIFREHLKFNNQVYSLLEVKPVTGRTHQIRVHLNDLGFPILGDRVYGRGNDYKRLMLHAWKLKLTLLSGKEKTIIANPDKIFFKL